MQSTFILLWAVDLNINPATSYENEQSNYESISVGSEISKTKELAANFLQDHCTTEPAVKLI